ncbi:double-strand break repair helicase AddA [Govanella unica]|uniref:DNA 3'-5' helicase n=1 Tax=Govanella unica TaxID=2975056 RepID=A0A9X3TZC6_9PROT|nr:double-strand break repair helicase AddA [Govania unica]MDA5194576.1 double-strand break repair helicase AddA [Govania unica]
MTKAQDSASDPAASAWVSASAGTGKTHVLTSRVLRLLLAGTPPERILCLTFTKAAAAEMSNRIQSTLARWVTLDDERLDLALAGLGVDRPQAARGRARRLFAEVLEVPGGLKILTIHAFCQSLLARFPLEASLPPHFRLIDDRSAAEVLRSALDMVLMEVAREEKTALSQALARISRRLTEYSFSDFVSGLLSERGLLERLGRQFQTFPGLLAATARVLGIGAEETAEQLVAGFAASQNRDDLQAAALALGGGTATDMERAALLGRWLELDVVTPADFRAYAPAYLTQKGEIRKTLVTKGTEKARPGTLASLLGEAERVEALVARLRLVEVMDNTAAALTFAFAVLDIYAREKRRQAALDYDDLILGTLALLQRPGIAPWVLFKLDGGLDHVLVDEAQDTNPEQWQVIKALADDFFAGEAAREVSRSIFAVGDVKQSIYRFQRADPRAFIASRDHFAARVRAVDGDFRDVPLDLSFRSTAAVLDYVDAVFADPALRGDLLDDRYTRHGTVRDKDAGLVELWPVMLPEPERGADVDGWQLPVDQTTQASAPARLAIKIAAQIRQWLRDKEPLPARGRAMTAGDILVLVRRRSAFDGLLLSALKLMGVPVAGADRMVVTDQLAVMDLMALARFVLLPEDDLTLATVLKSPLVGMSEDDLYGLAHGRRGSLWARVAGAGGDAAEFLGGLLGLADKLAPFDFFATVLNGVDASGKSGRTRIVARLGSEAHDPIDEFLALALAFEKSHTPSLQGFLHWLEARDIEIKRDMEQGRDEVRIMTVHGSKGLQAPVVIMPDTCQKPRPRGSLIPIDSDRPPVDRLLLWPGSSENTVGAAKDARDKVKALEDEEQARLLYVALTRAADRLYLTGWVGARMKIETGCWYEHLEKAFAQLPGVIEFDSPDGPVKRFTTVQTGDVRPDRSAAERREAAALPAWASMTAPDEPVPARPLSPSRPLEDEPEVQSPLRAAAARAKETVRFRRGTLIHRLLERLPSLAAEARAEAARRFLGDPAYGLSPLDVAQIVAEVMAILEDAEFAPIFSSAAQAEVPIAGLVDQVPVAGQIDRLYVTDSRVLVIDYKTNRPPPDRVEDVALAYVRQMAAYRRLLQQIYPGRRIDCALLWTDGARLMALPDQMLDRVVF